MDKDTKPLGIATMVFIIIQTSNVVLLFSFLDQSIAISELMIHISGMLMSSIVNAFLYLEVRSGNHQRYWIIVNILLGLNIAILFPLSLIDSPSDPAIFFQSLFWSSVVGIFCFWMITFLIFKFLFIKKQH